MYAIAHRAVRRPLERACVYWKLIPGIKSLAAPGIEPRTGPYTWLFAEFRPLLHVRMHAVMAWTYMYM